VTNSRIIISNQAGIHDQLETVVRRHLATLFQRPFADYSLQVFAQANSLVAQHQGPIILDSYCGVGESTYKLALEFPDALVLGIDKSSHRLEKHPTNSASDTPPGNYHLLRADVDDFWRLAVAANWKLARHYLLYPNPWPKSSQLKRRIHGSPLLPSLLALGGNIELRSNWPVYVEEFAAALTLAGYSASAQAFQAEPAITPFERKYRDSGHPLWRCICSLD
jgi:tRNA (guanine-N7-)-methyltransferase